LHEKQQERAQKYGAGVKNHDLPGRKAAILTGLNGAVPDRARPLRANRRAVRER
jgi:hypothetical protein